MPVDDERKAASGDETPEEGEQLPEPIYNKLVQKNRVRACRLLLFVSGTIPEKHSTLCDYCMKFLTR
jgi:hypothetical protein